MSNIELDTYNPWANGNCSERNKPRKKCGHHTYTWIALLLLCVTFLVCHVMEGREHDEHERDEDQKNDDIILLVKGVNISMRESREQLERIHERRTGKLEDKFEGELSS